MAVLTDVQNYQSDRTPKGDKPYSRANKVRTRLGWGGGVASSMGSKPKGMHLKTYLKLLKQPKVHGSAAIQVTDRLASRLKDKLASIGVAR